MTLPTRNQNAYDSDELDTLTYAAENAAYYPSLKDHPWDDELLPSGD